MNSKLSSNSELLPEIIINTSYVVFESMSTPTGAKRHRESERKLAREKKDEEDRKRDL